MCFFNYIDFPAVVKIKLEGDKVDRFSVVRLVALDLKSGIEDALIECLEYKIPVFISRPQSVTIWAIPNDFNESIDDYIWMKENEFPNPNLYHTDVNRPKPKHSYPNSPCPDISLQPLHMTNEVYLLQLDRADIERLLALKQTDVMKFPKTYSLIEKEYFEPINAFVTKEFPDKKFMPNVLSKLSNKPSDLDFSYTCEDFHCITCDGNKATINKYNDPLNHQKSITIQLDDCFVSTEFKNKLTEVTVQDIPQSSPYFVPVDCRVSSKLNKLAVLGHRFYENKTISHPENMAKYIEVELSIGRKEAEAAAFFINPEPNGGMYDEYKGVSQFKRLIEVSEEFYVDGKLKKEKKTKDLSQRVKNTFDGKFGYSEEKCRYAVKLITPDN